MRTVNRDVKNDLNSMKCELANFSAEIKDAFSALELESTKSPVEPAPLVDCASQTEPSPKISRVLPQQTEPPPKSRVLPQPISRESSSSETAEPVDLSCCREAQTSTSNLTADSDGKGFKEKEAKYKKDIYDLRVKLKELEVKMNHIKKKTDEFQNDAKNETISENLSNEKVNVVIGVL